MRAFVVGEDGTASSYNHDVSVLDCDCRVRNFVLFVPEELRFGSGILCVSTFAWGLQGDSPCEVTAEDFEEELPHSFDS